MDKAFVEQAMAAFAEWRKGRFVPGDATEICRNACYAQEGFLEELADAMSQCEPLRTEIFDGKCPKGWESV